MTEDDFQFTIPGGYSKARAIRYVISEMDDVYASRPIPTLSSDRSEVDEDSGDASEPGERVGPDEGQINSEFRGEASDHGISDASAIEGGGSPDERVTDGSDNLEIQASGVDVESTPAERVEPESSEGERQQKTVGFHFAAGQHCRGN